MVRTATLKTSVFNLVSTVVGGGVLSLPFTFAIMGVVFGPLALVVSAIMSDFSIYLLLSMSRRQGDLSYEDVAAKTLGEPARAFLLVLLFLLTFLCAAAYFVLAADLLQPIVTAFIDSTLSEHDARFYVMVGFMCLVGPLSFFKKLNALRFTSFLSIISISVLGVVLFYKLMTVKPTHFIIHPSSNHSHNNNSMQLLNIMINNNHSIHPIHPPIQINNGTILKHIKIWPNSFDDFMYALPISTVAYLCHFNVLPTNKELIKPTKSRIKRMIHSTIGICLSLYMVIAFCGYLFSLDLTCGDILNNYRNNDPAISIGRVGLVITLAMSFPLLVLPCRKVLSRLVYIFCCCSDDDDSSSNNNNNKYNKDGNNATASSRLLSKTDEQLLRNPVNERSNGLLSPIGTFITDSPANISARYSNGLRHKGYDSIDTTNNSAMFYEEQDINKQSPIGSLITSTEYHNLDNNGIIARESIKNKYKRGIVAKENNENAKNDIPLSMHIILTLSILIGSSQIALHVTSVVQIWSILGSSISILIAYIIPCSMYISLRNQQKYIVRKSGSGNLDDVKYDEGDNDDDDETNSRQLLDNINNSSTLFWAWVLLIFGIFTSICSTWQAIAQIKRPNCPHSIKIESTNQHHGL